MHEDAKMQFAILNALGSRYDNSPYKNVLLVEVPWLVKFVAALRKLAKNKSKLTKFRIDETIDWYLAEVISPKKVDNSEIAN